MASTVNLKQFEKSPLTTCVCDATGTCLAMVLTALLRASSSASPFAAISVPVTTSWEGVIVAFLESWNSKHLMHKVVQIVVII
jgi:hypothetical protein